MRCLATTCLTLSIAGFAAGAESLEKVEATFKGLIGATKEVTGLLEAIKSEDDAQNAIPKIEAVAKKINVLAKKLKTYKLSKDDDENLMKKYVDELQETFKKMAEALKDAGKNAPNHSKAISAALKKAG